MTEYKSTDRNCDHELSVPGTVKTQGDGWILSVGPAYCTKCSEVFHFIFGKNAYSPTAAIPIVSKELSQKKMEEAVEQQEGGPGTEMMELTRQLGVETVPGCSCKSTAATMDKLGVDGCRRRINELVLQVEANWDSWGWKKQLVAVTKAAWKAAGLGVNPTDPVRSLIELALHRAEQAEKYEDS